MQQEAIMLIAIVLTKVKKAVAKIGRVNGTLADWSLLYCIQVRRLE